ncbi:MAG: TSUP family transporter [Actinomycetales bacterium]|nr:TSUP family transporter [Actinomycetales bacterium]
MDLLSIDPALALGGLIAGLMVGLTGMGGAALVTPMLVLVFGVSPAVAVSSDVVASAIMKPVGAMVHIRARTVHWGLVAWLSAGSIPGVLLGTLVFAKVLGTDAAGDTIRTWVGWVLILAVLAMIAKIWVARRASGMRAALLTAGTDMPVRRGPTLLLGVFVGLLVGMTSVGSGSLVVTTMLLLYPLLRPSILVGTDLTQAVPMLIAGAIAHAGFGEISIAVVVSLLIGQIPGVWIGARMSSRYDGQALRWLLMVVLAATALKLLGVATLVAGMIAIAGTLVVSVLYVRERWNGQPEVATDHPGGRSVPATASEVS